ncbi:dual specificity protein phosphatase family protein [Piscirickettsia salmonis]|uniref:dual specificity protein phosphatase family protein n=1 Tax=Piscirickettsia salmonis TaxID=1238 RepID=UPI0007C8B8FB|nr:Dual specificity phosphatase, catalytic domain [Piscirickettsiaceae bacterium NZ-RLO1]
MHIPKPKPNLKLDLSNIDQQPQQGASAGPADDRHDLSYIDLPLFGKSKLYLGPEYQLKNALSNKGVKHVINVGNIPYTEPDTDKFKFPGLESAEERTVDGIQFLFCPAKDSTDQDLRQYFLKINQFLREAIETGQPIFIHCQQGMSRSASALSAFILAESKCSLEEAIGLIRGHRGCIDPNLGFITQLLAFQQSLTPGPSAQSESSMLFAGRSAANSETAEEAAQPPQL